MIEVWNQKEMFMEEEESENMLMLIMINIEEFSLCSGKSFYVKAIKRKCFFTLILLMIC